MPHEDHPTERPLVHYIPNIQRPLDAALCGVRYSDGSDNPRQVTCPTCKKKLEDAKNGSNNGKR